MLPAAKALLVTALLGGGTVGTYALAGGKFGAGGNGSGNAETSQTVATEAAVQSAAPETGIAPEAEVTRDGDNTLEDSTQQRAGLQTSDQDSSRSQTVDSASEGQGTTPSRPQETEDTNLGGDQNETAAGKANISSGEIANTAPTAQEEAPASSQTDTQTSKGSDSVESGLSGNQVETDEGRSGLEGTPGSSPSGDSLPSSSSNPGSAGDNGAVKNTEQTITSSPGDSNAGNEGDRAKGTGQGTDGEEIRTTTEDQGA